MACQRVLAALIADNLLLSPQADTKEISVANNARICCSCARLIDVYLSLASLALLIEGKADLLNHQ